jgi:hypothetical protein
MDSVQNRQKNLKNQGIPWVFAHVPEVRFCYSPSESADCKANGVWAVLTVLLTDINNA